MIRILVVDDEPQMLRDLLFIVNSLDPSYVALPASNAIEAQDMIQKNHFDIVITDINMPVMSGLELISWLKEQNHPAIPVVISGYSYFDYARKAMKLGVTDYLLRPADTAEIGKVISAVVEKIRQKRSQDKSLGLQKALTAADVADPNLLKDDEVQFMAVFCVGALTDAITVDDMVRQPAWNSLQLQRQLNILLQPSEEVWIFRSSHSSQTAIFSLSGKTAATRYHELTRQFLAIRGAGFGLTIAVSPLITSITQVSSCQRQLMALLQQKVVLGRNQLLFMAADSGSAEMVTPEPQDLDQADIVPVSSYEHIGALIRFNGPEHVKDSLKQVILDWKNKQLPQQLLERELVRLAAAIAPALGSEFSLQTIQQLESAFKEVFYNALTFNALNENLLQALTGLLNDSNRLHRQDKHERLICSIAQHIEEHLAEPLNNSILAGKFGLAPSYLSTLFRNKKGVSPIEYIAQLRIARAKEILSQSGQISTKEVAALVGYEDPFHFSKSFKKITGLSPTEYRKQNSV